MTALESPNEWRPLMGGKETVQRPNVGDLVGWRYAAWRVTEVRVRADSDLTDEDHKTLKIWKPAYRDQHRPFTAVLRHESGPLLVEQGQYQRLHDGTITIHLGKKTAGRGPNWHILGDRYPCCSCCGHPWPCREYDRDQLAAAEGKRLDEAMRTTDPGVCAGCLEPITTRQKAITFPEESLIVPGAPGPTFHAGRGACWHAAERYERDKRLVTYPDVARIASCPGLLFHHLADSREECTAENACTGAHGPAGVRRTLACVTRSHIATNDGCYPRPPSDCGYDAGYGRCLGADLSLGAPDPLTVGDEYAKRGIR